MHTRILILLSALVLIGTSGFAQKPSTADALESSLRTHVQYLASEQLEGRKTGEPGAAAAARYVAEQFGRFKLKPVVKAGNAKLGFMQPFPYVAGVSVGGSSYLRLIPADMTRESKLEPGITYMPFGNSINAEIANASLVFAGHGIVTPDKKYDDYAGLDVNGKVVLIFDGTPDANNPHSEFVGFNIHTKANIAREKGARAILVIATEPNLTQDRLGRLVYEPTSGETAIPVLTIARDQATPVLGLDSTRAIDNFEEAYIAKWKADPASARPALPSVQSYRVSLKVALIKKTVDAHNVIGIIEGRDPVLQNEAIVIGAHYDHLGRGGRSSLSPNSADIHHGADDNASGTAAVVELARKFAKEKNNKRTLIFMAFGGEEEGLLGSKHYVNNPVWPLDKTVAMINLDMVGRLNEKKLTIGGIGTATEFKALVAAKNKKPGGVWADTGTQASEADLNMFSLQLNEDGFGPSDHSSFYSKQIPVLFLFTGTHLDYHKPSDTFEKINFPGLTRLTYYVGEVAGAIDDNPNRPTYKKAQSSGSMTARASFNVSLGTIPSYAETNDGLGLDGVRDGSPAGKAGLKAGDKIIKLAGKDVRNISDYMFTMSTMKAGEEYEVIVKRGTETLTMKIVPAAAARR
jgi:aminopeptidase YwaD